MNKFKSVFLGIVISLPLAIPSYSSSIFYSLFESKDQGDKRGGFSANPFDDSFVREIDFSQESPRKSYAYPLKQAFVPSYSGMPQGREKFKLLYAGNEEPTTARIITKFLKEQYTFREKVHYLLTGKVNYMSITGTITLHGIITNAHGFIEEVPSVSNYIREKLGIHKRYYRQLEPVYIDQELTVQEFTAPNKDYYFDTSYEEHLAAYEVAHASYIKDEISFVKLSGNYIMKDSQRNNGWFYGDINSSADLALIKLEKLIPSHVTQIAEHKPLQGTKRVHIYINILRAILYKKCQKNWLIFLKENIIA